MTGLPRTFTVAEVAAALRQPQRYVMERCRRGEWPHGRGSRRSVIFTAEQVDQILRLIEQPVQTAPEPRLAFAPRSARTRRAS